MKQTSSSVVMFRKNVIVELNPGQLSEVDGGSSPFCAFAIASSIDCGLAIGFALGYLATKAH